MRSPEAQVRTADGRLTSWTLSTVEAQFYEVLPLGLYVETRPRWRVDFPAAASSDDLAGGAKASKESASPTPGASPTTASAAATPASAAMAPAGFTIPPALAAKHAAGHSADTSATLDAKPAVPATE
jgi:hypothetical protein